ncbi:RsmE family RNA methyltransferase [Flavihumibacter fluvii]|uniref:RsmE family RNA methyltransferase n=1 Tax=Flavihumibacter fluvii TaxID=2838157 RepID=UPI001BDECF26|nr:RsmE family RNA methyltransferase [Flavihumibacter fluvii]ULQ52587.1 16S rRNA (uracil(1498)-N(3))-methyltransferase [Flavihumibacter fluvii]
MTLPFFYSPDQVIDDQFILDEANSKHVVAVLRMQSGDRLHLTDGKGQLLIAEIISPHKKNCGIRVIGKSTIAQKKARVSLAISPVKNNSRFEWFLEKATEIGVAEIIPLICHRTEKIHFRFDRMQQILISAMLQSQQVWLPKLYEPLSFRDVILQTSSSTKWIAHCMPESRKSLRLQGPAQNDQLLLIGPEGDFTPDEIQLAIQSGFVPVTLGDARLRTETAGMVGACLLCIS